MRLRILAFDPGQKNCSVALIEYDSSKTPLQLKDIKIVFHGLLPSDATALVVKKSSTLSLQIKSLQQLLEQLKREWKPTHVILERYMTRGFGGGGNTTEVINILIGCILCSRIAPTKLIGASMWKNEVKRNRIAQGLEEKVGKHTCNRTEVYEGFEVAKGQTPVSAHQVDACMIAVYGLFKLLGLKPFKGFNFDAYDKKIKAAKTTKLGR